MVACVVGVDPKMLRRHYREELDTRQTRATAKVAVTDVTQFSDQELERSILFYQDEIARQQDKTLTVEPAHRP